ncbi:hydrolase [Streptomyces griseofuscus]|uniref:HAD family hydrolase n=1 Tax=Streptomyces griseofuscus TaxID=146922 RepID=UPI000F64EFD4|nr:HAD hydrolase-like protein [Streptomyces griseofuscus]RRQ76495.1 hydrolase [Streptomyces griseofuscus]
MTAVLFDFSGTLFRVESTESWLRLPEPELKEAAETLEAVGALPGGVAPVRVPEELAGLWARRDESAELHRAAYTGMSRRVPLPDPDLHDALYARHLPPSAWTPYPDARQVLHTLPDPRLFSVACAALGADPRRTLMVGDSREADGGAAALGCRVRFVDPLPAAERPNALLPVLDLVPDLASDPA